MNKISDQIKSLSSILIALNLTRSVIKVMADDANEAPFLSYTPAPYVQQPPKQARASSYTDEELVAMLDAMKKSE